MATTPPTSREGGMTPWKHTTPSQAPGTAAQGRGRHFAAQAPATDAPPSRLEARSGSQPAQRGFGADSFGAGASQESSQQPGQAAQPARSPEARKRAQKRLIKNFFIKLAVFVGIIWAMFGLVLGVYRMSGEAMYPRMRDGDLVVFFRLDRDFAVTDVATYEVNGRRHTARVVAMGGDTVELTEEGLLMVNGNVQTEEIFYETTAISGGVSYPYTVPEGSYFMLADNRTGAIDSRSYGAISANEIQGKVIWLFRSRGI